MFSELTSILSLVCQRFAQWANLDAYSCLHTVTVTSLRTAKQCHHSHSSRIFTFYRPFPPLPVGLPALVELTVHGPTETSSKYPIQILKTSTLELLLLPVLRYPAKCFQLTHHLLHIFACLHRSPGPGSG
jgi:hypothetical protein